MTDRFKEPDEPKVVRHCEECSGEIFSGDGVTEFEDGEIVHDLCEADYLDRVYVSRRGVMSTDGGID